MDFIIIVCGLLVFIPPLKKLQVLRIVKVFRPLRTISRWENMKKLIDTIIRSMGALGVTLMFVGFVFLLFAILGMTLFMEN